MNASQVLVAAIALAGALAGQRVGYWQARAEGAGQQQKAAAQIQGLEASNAALKLAIAEQNRAMAVADAEASAAREAAGQARTHAADLAAMSESRMRRIEQALKDASTVADVLSRYWELRQ